MPPPARHPRAPLTARVVVFLALAAAVGGCGDSDHAPESPGGQRAAATVAASSSSREADGSEAASGIHKIRHVVVIMQENRSFDSYFGTYPGADGIPMRNG